MTYLRLLKIVVRYEELPHNHKEPNLFGSVGSPAVFLSWNMGIESPAPVAVSAMEIVKTQ
jgi:hypothetical protein